MIERFYRFTCEDCKLESDYDDKDKARKSGWAIARDGRTCYCPACAFKHRNTGKGGAKAIITKGVQDSA